MTGYTSTTGKFKIGGVFLAAKTRLPADDESYGWYSYELEGWLDEDDLTGTGDTRTVNANAPFYATSETSGTANGTVSAEVTFYVVSASSVGSGSCGVSTSLYGGRFVVAGTSVTFTATPSANHKVLSFKVNGSESELTATANSDLIAVATFCPTSYSVKHETPSGGTSVVTVDETTVEPGETESGVEAGADVVVTATEAAGKAFLYTEVDGTRYVANPLTFQIQDRPSDDIFNIRAVFGDIASMTDTIVADGDGSVVVKQGDTVVELDDAGKFTATVGAIYTITATPGTGKRVDGFYENGRLAASGTVYTLIQDTAPRTVLVKFADERAISLNLFVGPDITAQTTEWNDCTCGVTTPIGTTVGTYTFAPSAADGYRFVRLYIEDLDGTGKGRVIPAGQSYAVYLDFNARVIAIFAANDMPAEPSDVDQGNATETTGIMKEWEGSEARMTAKWCSRRNVYEKPVAFAAARVYANGYANGLPKLTVATYASPVTTDGNAVEVVARNQDSFRLPKKRPEKYVEIEVASDARVLELAVSTSVGGLWDRTS